MDFWVTRFYFFSLLNLVVFYWCIVGLFYKLNSKMVIWLWFMIMKELAVNTVTFISLLHASGFQGARDVRQRNMRIKIRIYYSSVKRNHLLRLFQWVRISFRQQESIILFFFAILCGKFYDRIKPYIYIWITKF